MRATTSPRRAPAGFTLIELLVVISIIGILMGLLLGAVQKVRDVGKRTTTVSEISQLDEAVTAFKLKYGFNPPHKIRLPGIVPTAAWENSLSANQRESYAGYQVLLQMFKRWQIPGVGSAVDAVSNPTYAGIAPTGLTFCSTLVVPSVVKPNEEGLLLEGSQCLVFFLGGPELLGFTSSGPYSPPSGTTALLPPLYDFKASRMDPSVVTRVNSLLGTTPATPDVPNGYLNGYLDPYGTPYAYFSTFTGANYTKYAWQPPVVTPVYSLPMRPFQMPKVKNSDPDKWVNSGRIQIVSAGKNKRFGPGTIDKGIPPNTYWTPGGIGYALDAAVPNGDGGDDLANFNAGAQLGVVGN